VGQILASSPTPIGYIWEPFSILARPGTCNARWPGWFPYVCADNEAVYEAAVADTLHFRYRPLAELRSLRSPKDAGRMARDWWRFSANRRRGAAPLFKDPIALYSSEWLADRFAMAVIVLIRHPAAFTASVKSRQLRHPFGHFLAQPLLMRDFLEPYEGEIRRFAEREQDIVDQGILLWLVLHEAIARFQERRPGWIFLRLEDLSRQPVARFREMFERLGVAWDERVEALVRSTSDPSNPPEAARIDSIRRDSAAHVWNWKRQLTPEEIDRVRERTGALAARFYDDADW
jgi:hypothetical protein